MATQSPASPSSPSAPPRWRSGPPAPGGQRPWKSFGRHCYERLGSPPQIPPRPGLLPLMQEPRTLGGPSQGSSPSSPSRKELDAEELSNARLRLKQEIRSALRQCSSIQVLDATIAAAKGKLGRSPPEGQPLRDLLSVLHQKAKARSAKKVAKLISQTLRQEESHRRFSLARHGSDKKRDLRGPRKAIFRRGDELASVLQSFDPESPDLEKLIQAAFRQVGRAGRLSKKDLRKALRLCGFKDIRNDWLEEIYEGLTMVSFIGPEDFEKLVHEYDERQREMYLEAFKKFDVDCSDQISTEELLLKRELQEVLRSLGLVVQPSLIAEIMRKVDYDDSGELSFDEFEQLMKLLADSDGFPESEQEELKKAFKRFDSTGDGLLDSSEFLGTQGWLGYQLKKEDLEQIFQDADLDGRGTLDYSEFVQAMKAVREVEMKEVQQVFEDQDQDRNGLLSPTELEAALKALNYECDLQVVLEVAAQVQEARGSQRLELVYEDALDFLQRYRSCEGLTQSELQDLQLVFQRYESEGCVRSRDLQKLLSWFGYDLPAEDVERFARRTQCTDGHLTFQEVKKLLRMEREEAMDHYRKAYQKNHGTQEISSQQAALLFAELNLESSQGNNFELGLASAFRKGGGGFSPESFVRTCLKRRKAKAQENRETAGFDKELGQLRELFAWRSSQRRREPRDPQNPSLSADEVAHLARTLFVFGVAEPLKASLSDLLRDLERKPPATITFKAFLRHMRFFVDLYVKDYALREQWAVRDTGFSPKEVEDFRRLFAPEQEGLVPIGQLMTLSELRRALAPLQIDKSPSLASALSSVKGEALQLLNGIPKSKTDPEKNMVVNFPQFLRIAKQLLDAAAKEREMKALTRTFSK